MKIGRLLTEGTPKSRCQRKMKPNPLKEDYGRESLLLLGIGAEVKDCLQITNYDRQSISNRRRRKRTAV
jgi:hypothetical protein